MSNLKVRINLQKPFIEVDGKPTNDTLASFLSGLLLTEMTGDAMKNHIWGTTLREEKGILDIDRDDWQKLYDMVKATQRWTSTMKAQVMIEMEECRNKPIPPADRTKMGAAK